MMLRNDYQRGLFNGDQGLVLRVLTGAGQARTMAVFPRKGCFATFALDSLGADIGLSFAMTVHKSQGSEFRHVCLILPGKEMPLLNRELVYTAITRSKRSVTVLGAKELLLSALSATSCRYTGINSRVMDGTLRE
jgi:exodeoxyribonuclease V alpha subunit